MSYDEPVLNVRTSTFLYPALYIKHGFTEVQKNDPKLLSFVKCVERNSFLSPRYTLEDNPAHQQIIPYNIIFSRNGGAAGEFGRFLDIVYYLRAKGSEKRLRNLHSIGIGGHMNACDNDSFPRVLVKESYRELVEELKNVDPGFVIDEYYYQNNTYILGIVKDWSSDVGSVHTGIVLATEVPSVRTIKSNEEALIVGTGNPVFKLEDLQNNTEFALMESWSEYILKSQILDTLGTRLNEYSRLRDINFPGYGSV